MKVLFLSVIFVFSIVWLQAQSKIEWDETFGGAGNESANRIVEAADGGYFVLGYTESEGAGKKDAWLLKLNNNGEKLWDVTYGGEEDDELFDIIPFENGFALLGYTSSKGAGDEDYWLIITNSEGNTLWEKTYGGEKGDVGKQIIKGLDNNLVLIGESKSYSSGGRDIWYTCINPYLTGKDQGKILWKKNLGGTANEQLGLARFNKNDSLYYAAISTASFTNGGVDGWLTGITADRGSVKLKKNYGLKGFDFFNGFAFTSDSYAIACGSTVSKGQGLKDGWLLKLADDFDEEWDLAFGGSKNDEFINVHNVAKGYLAVGNTQSMGEGRTDIWLLKVDNKGNQLWETTFGDLKDDIVSSSIIDSKGNIIICGSTASKGEGLQDIWVIKASIK